MRPVTEAGTYGRLRVQESEVQGLFGTRLKVAIQVSAASDKKLVNLLSRIVLHLGPGVSVYRFQGVWGSRSRVRDISRC